MREWDGLTASPVVVATLLEAGWTPGRDVEIGHWQRWMASEGYDRNAELERILRSFGGLVVSPPVRERGRFWSGRIRFDPEWAATGEHDRIRLRGTQFGAQLWPIGEWADTYILVLAEDGRVFAESSDLDNLLIGPDFQSAINTLILADRYPETVSLR